MQDVLNLSFSASALKRNSANGLARADARRPSVPAVGATERTGGWLVATAFSSRLEFMAHIVLNRYGAVCYFRSRVCEQSNRIGVTKNSCYIQA